MKLSIEKYLTSKMDYPLGKYWMVNGLYADMGDIKREYRLGVELKDKVMRYLEGEKIKLDDIGDGEKVSVLDWVIDEDEKKNKEDDINWYVELLGEVLKGFSGRIGNKGIMSYCIDRGVGSYFIFNLRKLGYSSNGEWEGDIPIYWCFNMEVMLELMRGGANGNKRFSDGDCALLRWCKEGYLDLVKEGIKRGFDFHVS